jgi:uncharacterized Zn-binding protein involved in type VI secretion
LGKTTRAHRLKEYLVNLLNLNNQMGFPAARVGDMHICPMVTPGVPPVPHVGGPILPPGTPTVFIGGMPAAIVGNMCTCVGPPDSIVKGSLGVFICGMPAARMGDMTVHGGSIVMGCPTVLIGDMSVLPPSMLLAVPSFIKKILAFFGLSSSSPVEDSKAIIEKSKTLTDNIAKLEKDGWKIEYGEVDKGSFCDKEAKKIVIDPNDTNVAQTLAHETGHALYTADPYVEFGTLSRSEYVAKNANSALKDEGEATLMNAQIRNEIIGNGGEDIGIAGNNTEKYEKAYDEYKKSGDRDKARQEIGDIFADNEHPSTDRTKTYRENYSKTYEEHWDKYHPPTK